jgi:hypothetical protein
MINQLEVRLVNQRGRGERVVAALARELTVRSS